MNPRTAVIASFAIAAARRLGGFALRFLRDTPVSDHEQRIFHHLNGLIEAVVNKVLNRTFAPQTLRAV